MPYYTPLRYPGGKRRLVPVITRLLQENGLKNIQYVEPYAGGAAVALAMLLEEHAAVIHINDLDRAVYAFWHSVINDTNELCRRIERTPVTIREWKQQRAVFENRKRANLLDLGFAAFFLNRTNRSGIIAGGVIGGLNQNGAWGIDARFNKPDLIQRIRRIGRYRSRIKLYHHDARYFTEAILPGAGANLFGFYDPPYIESGEDLYLNEYTLEGHRDLAAEVCAAQYPWIVTYDIAAMTQGLYPKSRRLVFSLKYTAQSRYEGKEVMFLSDRLRVPAAWQSGRRVEIARPSHDVRVYGRMENPQSRSRSRGAHRR